jgi:hypothetical protein
MALTEETFADKVEVVMPSNAVCVRMATVIMRDGEEISRTFHRYVLEQGADLTGQPANVVAIATAAWQQ